MDADLQETATHLAFHQRLAISALVAGVTL